MRWKPLDALIFTICLSASLTIPAQGNDLFYKPGVMVGVAFDFGGPPKAEDFGITAKILSNRTENNVVVGAGVTFFPWSTEKFGIDASVGYNFRHTAVMGGYDFLRNKPQLSGGWSSTQRPYTPITPAGGPKICAVDSDCSGGAVCSAGVCVAPP
jgi:hypothetical protein